MCKEVLHRLHFWRERVNVLRLPAVAHAEHIVCLKLDSGQDWTIANWAVRSEEDEVVGHVWCSQSKVGTRLLGPLILEIPAVFSDGREARPEAGVETGRADKHINWVLVAIVTLAAALGDLLDFAVHNLDIWLVQTLEVVDARRQATAADTPLWNELVFEELVLELFLHLVCHVALHVRLRLCALEVKSPHAVQAGLVGFPDTLQDFWFRDELLDLVLGVDVLVHAEGRRNPCWLANEGRDGLDDALDCRKNLDPRGTKVRQVVYRLFCVTRNSPIANETNPLACKVCVLIPVCGVEQLALVVLETWDRRPPPRIEDTTSIDQDIA